MPDILMRHTPQAAVQLFFHSIAPFREAYRHATFSYLAEQRPGGWTIYKARLLLNPLDTPNSPRHLMAGNVMAGSFILSGGEKAFREFLAPLCEEGLLRTDHGDLLFAHPAQGHAVVDPFYSTPEFAQARTTYLGVVGDDQVAYFLPRSSTDWTLRAMNPPYDGIEELLGDFGLAPSPDRGALLEVFAPPVAMVDYNSPVSSTLAKPTVRMSRFVDPVNITLGMRVMANGRTDRKYFLGTELTWSEYDGRPDVLVGSVDVEVPEDAVAACYVACSGVGIHFGWIQDPEFVPNPNRAVIEAFDPGLLVTQDLLKVELGRGKGAQKNDLDDGVATLLWMMGFAISQIGRNNRTSDAVDIVARTPKGRYLLVECTTGILKAENKLANLVARAAQVKRRLAKSWSTAQVVPLIVTSLPREEVEAELRQAELAGVKVFTREDIDAGLESRTRVPLDPDQFFDEIAAHLQDARDSQF